MSRDTLYRRKFWVRCSLIPVLFCIFTFGCGDEAIVPPPDPGIALENVSNPDSVSCPCFTKADLDTLLSMPWGWGWWSDVPGSCKQAPYDHMAEVWITNVGWPGQKLHYSVQAGFLQGQPMAAMRIYKDEIVAQGDRNNLLNVSSQEAIACQKLLSTFIAQIRTTHPNWDYCVRFN